MKDKFIRQAEAKASFQHQFDEAIENIDQVQNHITKLKDISKVDRTRLLKLVEELKLKMLMYLGLRTNERM